MPPFFSFRVSWLSSRVCCSSPARRLPEFKWSNAIEIGGIFDVTYSHNLRCCRNMPIPAKRKNRWLSVRMSHRGGVSLDDYLRKFINYEAAGVPAGAGVEDSRKPSNRNAGLDHSAAFDLQRVHRLLEALGSPLKHYKVSETPVAGRQRVELTASCGMGTLTRGSSKRSGQFDPPCCLLPISLPSPALPYLSAGGPRGRHQGQGLHCALPLLHPASIRPQCGLLHQVRVGETPAEIWSRLLTHLLTLQEGHESKVTLSGPAVFKEA